MDRHFRHLENALQAVEHPTREQAERILTEYGMTVSSIARDVATIRDWLAKQPHLPSDDVDDIMIERLLVRCKNSVLATQRRIDGTYSVRSDMPEFYTDRDPLHPDIQQILQVVGVGCVPRLTTDLQRVSVIRLLDPDVSKFSAEMLVKVCNMGQDIVIREQPTLGDILIFDARGYTLAHAASASPVLIRKAISHVTRTYPARITGVHVMYPPAFADRIISIIKALLPVKVANRIHVHNTLETLLDHIQEDVLPKDYGGLQKSTDELCALWKKKLESYRDYFIHTEKIRSNEAARPEKQKEPNPNHGIEGSFRKLDID